MNRKRLEPIAEQLDNVMLCDRPGLRRRWRRLQSAPAGPGWQKQVDALIADVRRSAQQQAHRFRRRPTVQFDGSLPIMEHRDRIAALIRSRQTIVVAGETGSGKSTQLPKICLDAGFGVRGLIGHTQPRRIAARTIAARLADELQVSAGREVGYKIRFQDKTDPQQTFVKLMTDGILLAETQSDRFLDQYEVIILDEAHERSLNIDFLLGYLRGRLPKRPDLKLIITSATIDAERFSEHFADEHGPAPIVEVSGRTYPVEIRYRPLIDEEGDEQLAASEGIELAIRELRDAGRGDVLVFLPTERDIREMARRLRARDRLDDGRRPADILPLYARLSAAEQNRIFQPSQQRRIVLATNVAESSLTVPGIRYVVDTGTARISRYSARSKMIRLPIEAISQASADQRAGRCGRVAPGICIRLYDQQDYERRDPFTTPEIRRTNLASVILQAKALNLGEIETYPFLDPPRTDAIRDGYKTLFEIQAIDRHRRLTAIGKRLARMPVDPRIGRIILAADDEQCLHEVLIIASALEIQDPRERPHDKQQQADERHEPFLDTESDFISYLKLWDFFQHLKATVSRSQLRKACQHNFLSHARMREWVEIHRQLKDIAKQNRLTIGPPRGDYAAIHRALLTGLLSGVAYLSGEFEYTGAGGLKMHIWPGSGLFRERKQWIVAAERIETSRQFARTVARISPNWVEPLAQHLVKRNYSDPHWSRRAGRVMAYEKVSLMGMPIVVGRKVPYGKIDPEVSRQLFIQHALVDQRVNRLDRFVNDNRRMRQQAEELAAKTRRRDYLLDDYSIYAYYESRLPKDVNDVASMRRWLKADPANRQRVTMQMDDFLAQLPEETSATEQFPDQLYLGDVVLPVQYNFQPGAPDDGVTVSVPTAAVNQLAAQQLDWLVPGLFEERVVALIRSLPKSLRRNFVPVPDTAKRVVEEVTFGQGEMLEVLARKLSEIAEEPISTGDFRLERLPDHLRMNIAIVGDDGKMLAMGRDLDPLRSELIQPNSGTRATKQESDPRSESAAAPTTLADTLRTDPHWNRTGITSWDFGELPQSLPVEQGGIEITAYPALLDKRDSVSLNLLDTQTAAHHCTRRAIVRLFTFAARKRLKTQVRWLPRWDEVTVWAASVMQPDQLQDQLHMRIADNAFLGRTTKLPRDPQAFDERLTDASQRIAVAAQDVALWLPKVFESYHTCRLAIETLTSDRDQVIQHDLHQQLAALFPEDFLIEIPWIWLQQYPRYLQAIAHRVEKWKTGGQAKDQQSQEIVQTYWSQYSVRRAENDRLGRFDPELVEFRWMLEELRVSLFAQSLGTLIKISPQRMDKQWQKVE